MSSLFITSEQAEIETDFGTKRQVPFYLQFVPGYCIEVVHSDESLRYAGPNTINTIIALPHVTTKTSEKRSTVGEGYRYFPLLRTMNDVPSKGDPVLLCTIGRVNYYLGPLNMPSNSPTWNDDISYSPETFPQGGGGTKNFGMVSSRGLRGESLNFNKNALWNRLTKSQKPDLDYGTAVNETTGDTIIEGRHGNSLRIGSRSNNPYIFISNERDPFNVVEGIGDGSLISITSDGTLQEHFNGYIDFKNDKHIKEFQFSSDGIEGNTYPIADIQSNLNNNADSQQTIYRYNGNQMLFNSDRITINTKLDDIFVSSNKDIYIGSGRHLSLTSYKSINVLSENVNIGNPNKATMESMVLGEKLKEVLNDIINLLPTIKIPTMLGPQVPMPDIQTQITQITTKIDNITSIKHKIEAN